LAYGNEVIIGWRIKEFCKLFGLKMPTKKEWEEEDFEFKEKVANMLSASKLANAHTTALVLVGIAKNLRKPSSYPWNDNSDRYVEGDTSKGVRIFSFISMEVVGDEPEIGDEYPDDFVVGIPISGRYVPTYLDWKDENGTLETISLDEMQGEIQTIRNEIEKVEPLFKTAKIYVKMRFY